MYLKVLKWPNSLIGAYIICLLVAHDSVLADIFKTIAVSEPLFIYVHTCFIALIDLQNSLLICALKTFDICGAQSL